MLCIEKKVSAAKKFFVSAVKVFKARSFEVSRIEDLQENHLTAQRVPFI